MSFSLSGLPPLPKSLSGLLNIAGSELFFFGLGELLVTKYFTKETLLCNQRIALSPPPGLPCPARPRRARRRCTRTSRRPARPWRPGQDPGTASAPHMTLTSNRGTDVALLRCQGVVYKGK